MCTESFVNFAPLAEVQGRVVLKGYEARIHEPFPDFDVTFWDRLVEENRVAKRPAISGVHLGPVMDIEPTGAFVTIGNSGFPRMKGEHIAERWVTRTCSESSFS